ncbi:hypothetical protein, partial [Candidatus Allofournierella merdipullorum]|uniref:hypothetical protein n=1 Tax=Candidatus Allofournierella merdipullorum TaxID=2838595 RepID=UPI00374E4CBB
DAHASILGLCPHVKNPRLGRGFFILAKFRDIGRGGFSLSRTCAIMLKAMLGQCPKSAESKIVLREDFYATGT